MQWQIGAAGFASHQRAPGDRDKFLDYAMPRADLLPAFDTEISEVPSTTNPLGMRGGSEGGITPGLAAVANALVDALAEFDVKHIELPATPERVWNAIRAVRERTKCHSPRTV
jgi:carbon-monoxide dehydrogenase large subunit